MVITINNTSSRPLVQFGYLFHSMKKTLCCTIGNEGKYTWALQYTQVTADDWQWRDCIFCATWWAAEHPAEGPIPQLESLQTELMRVITLKFSTFLEQQNKNWQAKNILPSLPLPRAT